MIWHEKIAYETIKFIIMALMHHISVSVQALTPKLNQNPLPALISKLGWNALDMG